MTPAQLYQKLKLTNQIYLVDVREAFELGICKIDNAIHIPLRQIPQAIKLLPEDKDVVMMCHHGVRSDVAVQFLKNNGYSRVYNLEGGINRWALEVDKDMSRY